MMIMHDSGIYKNMTKGLVSDALCDEVDLSQFCQHVSNLSPVCHRLDTCAVPCD